MARTKKLYPSGQSRLGESSMRKTPIGKSYDRTTLTHPEAKKRAEQLATAKKNFARYLPGREMNR